MIKIFNKKETIELKSDTDTWIVKWKTYKYHFSDGTYPDLEQCYQAFTNKQEADEYAYSLNQAMKLLQMTSLPNAYVVKQTKGGIT